ncbi:MAG: SET domain-containing protein-lysine N-methyltransferase [Chthoniobacterales bacterium]
MNGGHIVNRAQLQALTPIVGPAEIQIADDLFICPVTKEERETSMIFSNHSCEPNLGVQGQITFVAMRDIAAGEELTHDWAMTDNDEDVHGMPLRRPNLPRKNHGQRLATAGSAGSLRQLFLSVLAREDPRRLHSLAMKKRTHRLLTVASLWLLFAPAPVHAQEAVMEEVIVEAPFDVRLSLPDPVHVQTMIDRILLRNASVRALELQAANRSAITTVLDLTRYSPIKFGAPLKAGDDFRFLDNYMRADLNPRDEKNPLFDR